MLLLASANLLPMPSANLLPIRLSTPASPSPFEQSFATTSTFGTGCGMWREGNGALSCSLPLSSEVGRITSYVEF